MFGFKGNDKSRFKAEPVEPEIVLPHPPVIVRQENIAAIKTLLANLTPQEIDAFVAQQKLFRYDPVSHAYPFGTNREPPVFAQFWEYEGMKPCCRVLCLVNKNGGFTLITKAETRLLTLFPGDAAKGMRPAALLSVPDQHNGVKISITGDNNVFKGIMYLDEADATRLMTERYAEAAQVSSHVKGHGPNCLTCPTGLSTKKLAATYG